MNSKDSLSGTHLRTYNTIFQHPVSHNLEWRAVHALFGNIGQIVEEPNGNFRVTRNGQVLVLHPPRTKDVAEIDEVMSLRHFLEKSEGAPPAAAAALRLLLVIDHHEARVFHLEGQGAPEILLPHEPSEHFRQAPHAEEFARGQEKPDPVSFFGPVAKALQKGGSILIFGTGKGTGSEMEQFVSWLKVNDAGAAARIVGTLAIDEKHMTDGQMLAKARAFFAAAGRS